ncbi:MAG: efflux RND transporter periplasmic adaptor subunit [Gammaproteobacteria bacterium]|nr:efflux RND transporter periplasmic adaptor subunit [Gammaproteobacteria bacterium]
MLKIMNRRTMLLLAVIVPMLILFVYVGMISGPLAPVLVTTTTIENRSISPALFGIGKTEVRYLYNIGPITAGRVKQVNVQVGDKVRAGEILAEMDPIDLDDRIGGQESALKRSQATLLAAMARVQEASSRFAFAESQATRYEKLLHIKSVSNEVYEAKQQELQIASAALAVARADHSSSEQELARTQADLDGLVSQRKNLRLVAPVDGVITRRNVEAGSTVVTGQAVVEMIDPLSLWVNVRFDQRLASGLSAKLPAQIKLRSRSQREFKGLVYRVEPMADAVTEEILAKVTFDVLPAVLPPIGELTEVTVSLPPLTATPVVPNASLQQVNGRIGVWLVKDDEIQFSAVKIGASSLDGYVQILEGPISGAQIVVYSQRLLNARSRIKITERLTEDRSS